jgi:predicted amidophosphoribosyltransferase
MSGAIAISKGLVCTGLLFRMKNTHQVGSTRKQRLDHMVNAFGVKNCELFKNKTVVIVDDVFTTGSSMESAARLLKHSGARRVIGAVFARAE